MKYSDFKPGDWGYRKDNDNEECIFFVRNVSKTTNDLYTEKRFIRCNTISNTFKDTYPSWLSYLKFKELRLATTEEILLVYPKYKKDSKQINFPIF